ncbi:PH domain-containing protein [Enhydrobacter aerosaccus]|uniref:PH domain-containing protein n=1 Tax=Enhydrobacter aerosaccus TaxID=225324 RepID=A0A1T4KQI9_9HYPH|nr:PH domain-containing protein [Enhydrobacter aerosaccus]SJZ44662.1 PH domain-containing protein [Enhydrobacter aerosaccus]
MAYVNSILQPGESIRAIGKLHWIVFTRAFALLVVGLVVLIYAGGLPQQASRLVQLVGWGIIALAALAFLQAWFVRWITEFAITTHRLIYKRGFLSRYTVEMNMDKVETVNVDQSLLGRLLDYGSIRVLGTGQGIEKLEGMASPIELRNAINGR